MLGILLPLLILTQANPTGVVTGIVRNSMGMPAVGVRVYAVSENDAGKTGIVLESISQTDNTGRYRLEIPAGRYYIAAGSVDAPTYFPGTSNVAAARVISITSSAVIDGIDFSGFVPAARSPLGVGLPFAVFPAPGPRPDATGVLSGVIRYSDGTPAAGLFVSATPVNLATARLPVASAQPIFDAARFLTMAQFGLVGARGAQTDSAGRFRIDGLPPETYYIAAGFADSPTLYPGVAELAAASPITTTPTTKLDTVDFTIPTPPKGTAVSGKIFGAEGKPAGGANVQLRLNSQGPVFALLPGRPFQNATSRADGTFEIAGVIPGRYALDVRLTDASPIIRNITVADQPIADLEFSFPIAVLSGQILWEDGSRFSDARLREVAVVTNTNPNAVLTTIFPVDATGTFSRTLEINEYRFYIRNLSDDYSIKSITAGGVDLTKEPLKIASRAPVKIEVRVVKREGATGTKVRGKVLEVISGKPAVAEAVQLCCTQSGPVERLTTRLQPDGSFEFAGVPPGSYTAELQGVKPPQLVDHTIEVGTEDVSGITIGAAAELKPVAVRVVDGGVPRPIPVLVVFTGELSVLPITSRIAINMEGRVWLPVGDRYKVSVSNVPEGFTVSSISPGIANVMDPITITLSPK